PFSRRKLNLVAFFADYYRLVADHDFWTSVAIWAERVANFLHLAPPDSFKIHCNPSSGLECQEKRPNISRSSVLLSDERDRRNGVTASTRKEYPPHAHENASRHYGTRTLSSCKRRTHLRA